MHLSSLHVLSVLIIHFFIMQAEIMEMQKNEVIAFFQLWMPIFPMFDLYIILVFFLIW